MTERGYPQGVTLPELMIGMALLSVMVVGFSGILRFSVQTTLKSRTQGEAQEDVRQALMRIEEALAHANEVRLASATLVEFVCDADQGPFYNEDADPDADGIPNFRDADRDGDAQLLLPAATQWQAGFNLKDDDEDGDGQVDVVRRIYLSGTEVRMDTSLNGSPWGARVVRLLARASTLSFGYFGNRANILGRQIDLGGDGLAGTVDAGENDGIISSAEMDAVVAPAGMGNRNGLVDTVNERRYLTSIRVTLGSDRDRDGRTDYVVETDVYPPLLPLKNR